MAGRGLFNFTIKGSIAFLFTFSGILWACSNHKPGLEETPFSPTPFQIKEPDYFVSMQVPEDNPLTEEGIELGRQLFYDPILSRDLSVACSNCHQQQFNFTDGQAFSKGVDGHPTKRSALPIINLAYHYKSFFWDGRVSTLEEQALHPILDTLEMDFNWQGVEARLRQHPLYPGLFRQAFGIRTPEEITKTLVTNAIAQFERSLVSFNSKYDRVLRGEEEYTEEEFRGHQIFFDADENIPAGECAHCHTEPLFTNLDFFNNGIQQVDHLDDFSDPGKGGITKYKYDNGKFKTPSLRNITLSAPYMHDGRFGSLEEVIDHYASGGHFVLNVSPNVRQLNLLESDKSALIAFLHCLTDSTFINEKRFADPFLKSKESVED